MSYKTISTASILDCHYFAAEMAATGSDTEERRLYLEQIRPLLKENETNHRGKVLSLWVQAKKSQHQGLTPGQIFNTTLRFIFFIFILSGFTTGIGAAISYLTYSGTKPVNIAVYFIFFVFVPLLILAVSLVSLLSLRFKILSYFFQTPYAFVLYIIRKSAMRLTAKISGEKRLQIEAAFGMLRINNEKYNRLYLQTLFKLFQITGLMFSTGVLLATLFKVITTDLAFGWQTTIQTAPATIHKIVQALSLPWSWAVPDHLSSPVLAQIEGSRIILKEGIENLLSSHMASWWPFLCFAVFFYTILPRFILYLTGRYLEIRDKKKWLNTNHTAERIVSQLTSFHMTFGGTVSVQHRENDKIDDVEHIPSVQPYHGHTTALIPEDIYDTDTFRGLFEEASIIIISGNIDEDLNKLKKMTAEAAPSDRLILVCEAWLPPIKETLDYLKRLRELTGKGTVVVAGLIGKPSPGEANFLDVSDSDFKVWQNKIMTLGDETISLVRY